MKRLIDHRNWIIPIECAFVLAFAPVMFACHDAVVDSEPEEEHDPTITVFSGIHNGGVTRVEISGAAAGYQGPYKVVEVGADGLSRYAGVVDPKDPFAIFDPADVQALREVARDSALMATVQRLQGEGLSTSEVIDQATRALMDGTDPSLRSPSKTVRRIREQRR